MTDAGPENRNLFDRQRFAARMDHDEEIMFEVLTVFVATSPERLLALGQAVAEGRFEAASQEAHALKSALAIIAVPRLAELAQEIELGAGHRSPGSTQQAFDALNTAAETLIEEVRIALVSMNVRPPG